MAATNKTSGRTGAAAGSRSQRFDDAGNPSPASCRSARPLSFCLDTFALDRASARACAPPFACSRTRSCSLPRAFARGCRSWTTVDSPDSAENCRVRVAHTRFDPGLRIHSARSLARRRSGRKFDGRGDRDCSTRSGRNHTSAVRDADSPRPLHRRATLGIRPAFQVAGPGALVVSRDPTCRHLVDVSPVD